MGDTDDVASQPILKRQSVSTTAISLILLGVTIAVFWRLKTHEFLNFDDDLYVTQNPHVKAGLTFRGLGWAFTDRSTGTWHPLTWLSLMLDDQLFGQSAAGFHLTNLFFHLADTGLLSG
jgi:hypothetical protein